MKRLIVALLVGAALTGLGSTAAQAATTPPPAPNELGLAIQTAPPPQTCGVTVILEGTLYETAIDGTFKVNVSSSGDLLFQCRGDLITPAPRQGLVVNSDRSTQFACWNGSGFVETNDWTIVITPSGKLKYSCHA